MPLENGHIEEIKESVQDGHTGEVKEITYTKCSVVGHGSFGTVFQTHIYPDDEPAAIKKVLQDKRFKNRELQIMRSMKHKNIINMKYFFFSTAEDDKVFLNLVLEFMPETLYKTSHWYLTRKVTMPLYEVKLYSYQLMRSLCYIHSMGICHRDIKPQNLLIDPYNGILKLCDFGSAKILIPSEPNVSYICSRYYRAPELIFGATNYTTKIDVWSAGCVIAEMLLGQPLFPGDSGIDQLVEIIKILGTPSKDQIKNMNPHYMDHKFPFIKPIALNKVFKKVDNLCIDMLMKLLEYSPIERISAIESLTLPFFDEIKAPDASFPDYRFINDGEPKPLPDLLDFNKRELSINPELIQGLIPGWKMSTYKADYGIDLDTFIPYSSEELANHELN